MGYTFGNAPFLLAQVLACIVLIFFLLVFGPNLFNVFVRDFPIVTNKRRTLVLVDQIQRELFVYRHHQHHKLMLRIIYSRRVLLFRNRRCVTLGSAGCADELCPLLGWCELCGIAGSWACSVWAYQQCFCLGLFLILNIIESQLITLGAREYGLTH